MRWPGLLALALACGCSRSAAEQKAQPAPVVSASPKHEDRHDPARDDGPPISIEVKLAGTTKHWTRETLEQVPRVKVGAVANDGEDRDTWSLRELAHALVGPEARVVRVVGEDTRSIDRAAWDDPAHVPVLHTTRRGTLKFRWTDAAGKWGDTAVKDVSRLEIER